MSRYCQLPHGGGGQVENNFFRVWCYLLHQMTEYSNLNDKEPGEGRTWSRGSFGVQLSGFLEGVAGCYF